MTGTYDRGSLVLDEVVPVADLRGRRRHHLSAPPAPARPPDHAPDLLDRPRRRTAAASSAPRATPTRSPTRGRSASTSPTQARVRVGVPYAGYALSRARPSRRAHAGDRAAGAADRRLQPRAPVAPARRGGRAARGGGRGVSAPCAALARPRGHRRQRREQLGRRLHRATRQSPGNSFVAAADFNTVAVSITDPGTPLRGTVALQATASSERGIERVALPVLAGGRRHVDRRVRGHLGALQLHLGHGRRGRRLARRARAGRRPGRLPARLHGHRRGWSTTRCPPSSLDDPGVLQATETLTATGSDAGSGLASLAIAHRPVRRVVDDALHRRDLAALVRAEHDHAPRRRLRAARPLHRRRRQRARRDAHAHGRQHRTDRLGRPARAAARRGHARDERRRRRRHGRHRRSRSSSAPPAAAPGRRSAPTPPRRTSAPASTPRRCPTASTRRARSPPTARASAPRRRSSRTSGSTTRRRRRRRSTTRRPTR